MAGVYRKVSTETSLLAPRAVTLAECHSSTRSGHGEALVVCHGQLVHSCTVVTIHQ